MKTLAKNETIIDGLVVKPFVRPGGVLGLTVTDPAGGDMHITTRDPEVLRGRLERTKGQTFFRRAHRAALDYVRREARA